MALPLACTLLTSELARRVQPNPQPGRSTPTLCDLNDPTANARLLEVEIGPYVARAAKARSILEREVDHTPAGQTVSLASGLGDRSVCNLDQRFHPIVTAVISLRGPRTFILTTSANDTAVPCSELIPIAREISSRLG